MKTFLIFLVLGTIFFGCAQQNAFDQFQLKPEQELGEDGLQSSKLKNREELVDGVATVVYLNKALPKKYNDAEYFYVYLYKKNKKNKISFFLNGKTTAKIEKLPVKNRFTQLTSFEAPWSSYYLVKFNKIEGDKLNFRVKEGSFSSDVFKYEKDQ
ncbi:hypothetical protein [Sulfurimonas sp.]